MEHLLAFIACYSYRNIKQGKTFDLSLRDLQIALVFIFKGYRNTLYVFHSLLTRSISVNKLKYCIQFANKDHRRHFNLPSICIKSCGNIWIIRFQNYFEIRMIRKVA